VGCQVLKFRHSLFYFRRVGETGSDAHQIQAMPLGGANCRDNYAITGALIVCVEERQGEGQPLPSRRSGDQVQHKNQ
jgi:hypothetical protein